MQTANEHPKLKRYKASAGSGKTYTLANYYASLLIQNPHSVKEILAVTFTIKATIEMKVRIIKVLHELANKPNENLKFKNADIEQIKKDTNLAYNKIHERSKQALFYILHNYQNFQVSTIDSFLLHLFRGFAREAQLPPVLDLELDVEKVVSEITDELLFNLVEKSPLLNALYSKLDSNLEEGKTWNIRTTLVDKGKLLLQNELFAKYYQTAASPTIDEFNDIRNVLLEKKQKYEVEFKNAAKACLKVMNDLDVTQNDFKKKSNNAAINNIVKATDDPKQIAEKAFEYLNNQFSEDYFISSNNQNDAVQLVYTNGIQPFINQISNTLPEYITLTELIKTFHELGISLSMLLQLSKYRADKETILLKDITVWLSSILMQGQDAANFIFEKTGLSVNHVLLDEFQDTSRLQWIVFKSLIDNALSTSNGSALLVGDTKQSIYRWRNGDWRIMEEDVPMLYEMSDIIKSENWRSCENIIKFNNELYNVFPKEFADYLEANKIGSILNSQLLNNFRQTAANVVNIYGGHQQKLGETGETEKDTYKKGKGYVKIVKGEIENVLFNVEAGLDNKYFNQLCEDINACFKHGYQPTDMAILVRDNKTIEIVMTYINRVRHHTPDYFEYDFTFETENNVELKTQSLALFFVNIFAAILYFNNKRYCLAYIKNSGTLLNQLLKNNKTDKHAIYNIENDEYGLQTFIETCSKKQNESPFQLMAFIYQQFPMLKNKNTTTQMATFIDFVLQYQKEGGRSIKGFLNYWEEEAENFQINTGENANSIKLMTIHKAKGLQFPIVFFATTAYQYEKSGSIFWTKNESTILKENNNLPIVPLSTNKKLLLTEFAPQYIDELIENMIDNINLMYVATTRAIDALYIYLGKKNDANYFKRPFSKAIMKLESQNLPNFKENETVLEIGDDPINNPNSEIKQETKYDDGVFALNTMHKNIVLTDVDYSAKSAWNTDVVRQRGKLVHKFFERLSTPAYFNKVIFELQAEGWFEPAEKDEIEKKLKEILQKPIVQTIYSKENKRYRERKITTEKAAYRPDIVAFDGKCYTVLDFKTGKQTQKNQQQIENYAKLLKTLKNKPVKTELLYIDLNTGNTRT